MRFRRRTRSDGPFHRDYWSVSHTTGPNGPVDHQGPYTNVNFREEIWDVVDRPRFHFPQVSTTINPVHHVKANLVWKLGSYVTCDQYNCFHYQAPQGALWCGADVSDSIGHVPFSDVLPSLSTAFLDSIDPNFQTNLLKGATKAWEAIPRDADFANDLLELKQLKDLVPSLDGIGHELHAKRDLWRRNSDGTINSFLKYNFGVKPLVSSVKSLMKSVGVITKRLEFLRKTRGKVTTLTYSGKLPLSIVNAVPGYGTWNNSGTAEKTDGVYSVTLGCKLFQTLTGYDELAGFLAAFGRYGGFNRPLRIAWNAIPYSFLIDWCFDTSKWLDKLVIPDVITGTYEVHDFWTSVKFQGKVEYFIWNFPSLGGGETPYADVHVELFMRVGCLPKAALEPPLTPLQQALLFGLIWQQKPH